MFRPLFSASHSAKFEHASSGHFLPPENRHLWTPAGQAERRAELWGSYGDELTFDALGQGQVSSSGSSDVSPPPGYELEEEVRKMDVEKDEGENNSSSHGDKIKQPAVSLESETTSLTPSPQRPVVDNMAPKTRLLVSLWFLVTIPLIFWDAGYCLLRPRSMVGGDLHWIWPGYDIYANVDYVYGLRALEGREGFTSAQASLNLVENTLNISYLYLAHISKSPVAPLVGFASVVMTLSKTVLYWAQEWFCGYCSVGHNDLYTLLIFWIIPNGLWLVFPSIIVYQLGKDISASLRAAHKIKSTKTD